MKKFLPLIIIMALSCSSKKELPKVAINTPQADPNKCVLPTLDTIQNGSYPLARPLYLYVNKEALPETSEFLQYILTEGQECVNEEGFVGIDLKILQEECKKLGESKPTDNIKIDGSSTLFPLLKRWSEDYRKTNPNVQIELGGSGTGSGFKKFLRRERAINAASRPISDSEKKTAKQEKIQYVELRVALDGLSVLVNKNNDWCDNLSIDQLKEIWKPDSKVTHWNQINPDYPNEEIRFYGPDSESGTFTYFTEAVVGVEKASRSDYNPSTDDNMLVQGVAGDEYSLGYFGYSYYIANKDKLKVLGIEPAKRKNHETR